MNVTGEAYWAGSLGHGIVPPAHWRSIALWRGATQRRAVAMLKLRVLNPQSKTRRPLRGVVNIGRNHDVIAHRGRFDIGSGAGLRAGRESRRTQGAGRRRAGWRTRRTG